MKWLDVAMNRRNLASAQFVSQIMPTGIYGFDQLDLP
jgi:hypothetical protein